jgi:hypothetical protein
MAGTEVPGASVGSLAVAFPFRIPFEPGRRNAGVLLCYARQGRKGDGGIL